MKKTLKQFGLVLIAVLAVSVLLTLFRFVGTDSALAQEVEKLWGVELPEGYGVAYRAATAANMKGGGLRYHLLSYAEEVNLAHWLDWGDGTQPARYADTCLQAAEDILSALNVPAGDWPEANYVWYMSTDNGAELVIFYDDLLNQIYLVESCK